MIPYDVESQRMMNASSLSAEVRRFALTEFAPADRAWALRELAELGGSRVKRRSAWTFAALAYFSPR